MLPLPHLIRELSEEAEIELRSTCQVKTNLLTKCRGPSSRERAKTLHEVLQSAEIGRLGHGSIMNNETTKNNKFIEQYLAGRQI